jgi:cytochrome c oxidase assembly protein subunit 15
MTPVRIWLWTVAVLIFLMVIVGGATRLTDSGLSITEWQPLLGAIPPLTHEDWIAAFEKYKLIPEYQTVNLGMTLTEFKFIYWWEWAHRFLGRLVGVVFVVPFVLFVFMRRISLRLFWQLSAILILGGLQGALGWYMVMSGLVDRVDVSQYRLAAHLTLAALLFGAVIWTALGIGRDRRWRQASSPLGALLLVCLIVAQLASGAFVAGLDAGMGYNTWPKMDQHWIPPGLLAMEPVWRNAFENALTVQFNHRVLAYLVCILSIVHAWRTFSMSAMIVAYVVLIQIGLGVLTLLLQVPIAMGLVHQGGALIVLAVSVWHLHRMTLARPGFQFEEPVSSQVLARGPR